MKGKLIILQGVPGSGKSTFTENYIKENHRKETIVSVNRDTIRENLFGADYHKGAPQPDKEKLVTEVQYSLVKEHIAKGHTVIDDNTNLNSRVIHSLIKNSNVNPKNVSVHQVEVPLEVALERNRKRGESGGRFVPEDVIRSMYKNSHDINGKMHKTVVSSNGSVNFIPHTTAGSLLIDDFNKKLEKENPIQGKAVVLVDCDGTLFNNEKDAVKYFQNPSEKRKNFPAFYRSITEAPVNDNVLGLTDQMREDGLNLVILTGRSDDYAKELIEALERSGVKASKLIMKKEGDFRPSHLHKEESLKALQDSGFIVAHALDDRESDLSMFKKNGVTTTAVKGQGYTWEEANMDVVKPTTIDTPYQGGTCIRCGSSLKDQSKTIGDQCARKLNLG